MNYVVEAGALIGTPIGLWYLFGALRRARPPRALFLVWPKGNTLAAVVVTGRRAVIAQRFKFGEQRGVVVLSVAVSPLTLAGLTPQQVALAWEEHAVR